MNIKCSIGFHKWKPVYTERYPAYGKIPKRSLQFRICERCGKVQKYIHFPGEWEDLPEDKVSILTSYLKDEGDYYMITEEELKEVLYR